VNLLVTSEGRLRPLDFEGACPVDQPDPMFWGTPGFTLPNWSNFNCHAGPHDDLYSLGSMLYLFLTGSVPETNDPIPIERLRRNVPPQLRDLVLRLLSHSPKRRPTAQMAARELKAALSSLNGEA
jgi:serine/threonine protein kinase